MILIYNIISIFLMTSLGLGDINRALTGRYKFISYTNLDRSLWNL